MYINLNSHFPHRLFCSRWFPSLGVVWQRRGLHHPGESPPNVPDGYSCAGGLHRCNYGGCLPIAPSLTRSSRHSQFQSGLNGRAHLGSCLSWNRSHSLLNGRIGEYPGRKCPYNVINIHWMGVWVEYRLERDYTVKYKTTTNDIKNVLKCYIIMLQTSKLIQ